MTALRVIRSGRLDKSDYLNGDDKTGRLNLRGLPYEKNENTFSPQPLLLTILTACAANSPAATAPAGTPVAVVSPAGTLSLATTPTPLPAPTANGATPPAAAPSATAPAAPTCRRRAHAPRARRHGGPHARGRAVRANHPAGRFGISVFATGLNTPRNIANGPDGFLYVAERGAGRIVRLADRNHDGVSDGVEVIAQGFDRPSSLAFHPDGSLYVSTPTQVFRLSQPNAAGVFQKRDVVIDGLPGPLDHFTRTLLFSADGSTLYIQVGSSCNVCTETDARRATIMRFNANGSGGAVYAKGLRNAVGITFRPGTGELWATNNGTDNLGDNVPPDTVQIVQQGQDYGWPRCHAGTIVDPAFGGSSGCNGVAAPLVKLQAHSAALGLAFYTGSRFPADYRGICSSRCTARSIAARRPATKWCASTSRTASHPAPCRTLPPAGCSPAAGNGAAPPTCSPHPTAASSSPTTPAARSIASSIPAADAARHPAPRRLAKIFLTFFWLFNCPRNQRVYDKRCQNADYQNW